MLLLYIVAPEGHVSPETEQVSSPGSASSTHLEEHDEEDFDDDDDDDDDDAAAAAIDTQIQASDHEEVPIETVLPPKRPANTTYDAIVASEGKIVEAENRRHSDLMTVLERMIALQEETVSQLAHLHRVFIEVPKQLQKINTSFEALVVQQTQANYWRMTNVPQFNTSQPGSVHAGQFSPHSSDIHSPGPNVTGQVADIAVQVPDDILPLPSVQIQQQTPTKEATKTKQDTHETDQPSLVQCLPTCSHVSVGTSPVREQSLPKSPVGESLPKSPVGESLPKSPVGESLPKSPVGESLPKSPVGESLPKNPVACKKLQQLQQKYNLLYPQLKQEIVLYVLQQLQEQQESITSYTASHEIGREWNCLTQAHWKIIALLCKLLKPFELARQLPVCSHHSLNFWKTAEEAASPAAFPAVSDSTLKSNIGANYQQARKKTEI
ncbi:uncharacterized protein LOC142488282 [Ascaphus truei]|uniref:uncharacterized protein LOC142488282 n=1 Tax=Ascaphus truei TaxID=8439 RepID=UPI003F592A86